MVETRNKYRKIRKIRDVIYDYIEITPIEERIINSKDFQRLRHISQNSLAYFTYPSNTTNRFSHSLGVMHLGGKMFIKALNNSKKEVLIEFIKDSKVIIEKLCIEEGINFNELVDTWITRLGNFSKFNHLPLDLSEPEWFDKESVAIINILWQSVRIGCILHDIGHYPYSHLFEFAFKKFQIENSIPLYNLDVEYKKILQAINLLEITKQTQLPELPLHEMNGVILLDSLRISENADSIDDKISNLCLKLGKIIFIYNKSEDNQINIKADPSIDKILECLHTIISSDIDADRLDYCSRDPNNSGMELGAYDLQRIIDATILKNKSDSNGYEIVFSIVALSAIEEFFHQRYLMYEYLIFHHNVLRLDGTLEYVILEILKVTASNKDEEILKILDNFSFIKRTKIKDEQKVELFPKKDQFYFYDDAWFKTLLLEVYNLLLKRKDKNNLLFSLELVLFRNTNHIHSMWKRNEDAGNFVLEIKRLIMENNDAILEEPEITKSINELFNLVKQKTNFTLLNNINKELNEIGVTLIYKTTNKKIFKIDSKNGTKVLIKNKVKPIENASKYLKSLKFCSEDVINYNFFFISQDIKNNGTLIKNCKEILQKNIINYIIIKR